ncbi:Adaptin_N domain-containing protein [Cephalotus follicularis]|uniref:AP-3 complex subunit delta n=1 Tax=Cephalotus follicularis TaxID=3775 RepID=A0A1Q3CKD8_CEPFO|nr:Adaptin_N domain-containing protein [Cephalotus follicularis]
MTNITALHPKRNERMTSPSLMDTLFQRTLEDLIKGIRLQLMGESSFISKAIEEIRREIKSTDLSTKSIALHKLTYLNSIHAQDMSWAAFHAVEVLSSHCFAHKKVGYLAISQSFSESTPVLLLITNQLRKDLSSTNEFEVGLALECLSRIATVDLARDLTPEVFTLLGTSKVFVRKKAVAVVLRVFGKYPDAVRVCFKRLVENLETSDQRIVSAVVGVFCELALNAPRSYLPLAPEFYRILVDSKNNWILIKVLKIFAKLAALEPRLAKRVVEPVCEHMRRTGAKSLMFECIRTVVSSLSEYEPALKLAVMKICEFLVDDDPNLKYLGLHALSIAAPKHLWAVLENKEVVIKSLSDVDPNVKLESLRLVMAMVSESNVVEISRVLVNYALKSDPEFCNKILGSILSTCCSNLYEVINDFDWYVSLLEEMSRIPHCQKGEEIESQLIDIGMRVKDVRPELVRVSRDLLIDPALLGNPFLHRILSAAAWVSGEYVEFSRNPIELMEALLQPRTSLLPPSIMATYIQASFKVIIYCLHVYLFQKENLISSSYPDNLALRVSDLFSERECAGGSDLASGDPSVTCEKYEGFNPRVLGQSFEDLSTLNVGDVTVTHGQTSTTPVEMNSFTHESIVNLLNLLEMALGPLSGSHDVELQERTKNVLGFIDLIKQEMCDILIHIEGSLEREDLRSSKVVALMHDAFLKELGPVSTSAQERVPIPDGLELKENLADLDEICGDAQLPSNSFSLGNPHYGETVGVCFSNFQINKYSDTSHDSTYLIAEHRQRHDLYYLPSEKGDTVSNDYPPANDPKIQDNLKDDTEDLAKLTEQSLVPGKKSNLAKPRPVVVKLDEGDGTRITVTKPEPKDDMLSGAVRDILLGNEGVTISSQSNQSDKPSIKRKGKEKLNMNLPSESKENFGDAEKPDYGNPSSRKIKYHSHGKQRRHRSPSKKNAEAREENGRKEKQKNSHHHVSSSHRVFGLQPHL